MFSLVLVLIKVPVLRFGPMMNTKVAARPGCPTTHSSTTFNFFTLTFADMLKKTQPVYRLPFYSALRPIDRNSPKLLK